MIGGGRQPMRAVRTRPVSPFRESPGSLLNE